MKCSISYHWGRKGFINPPTASGPFNPAVIEGWNAECLSLSIECVCLFPVPPVDCAKKTVSALAFISVSPHFFRGSVEIFYFCFGGRTIPQHNKNLNWISETAIGNEQPSGPVEMELLPAPPLSAGSSVCIPRNFPAQTPAVPCDCPCPPTGCISGTYQTGSGLGHQESYHLQLLWTVR